VTLKLIALVVPLGLDTFAVAASLGLAGMPPRRRLRISLLMAGFEAAMPLVGLALGAPLGQALGSAADYLAIAVLIAFGVHTLVAADDGGAGAIGALAGSPARVGGTLLVALSVSLDELAIGFTLGLLRLPVVLVIVLIGAQAFVVSQLGLRLGARIGARLREAADRLSGLALSALGIGLLLAKVV
jgi:putative Mn2+ efflux pump MntP